jgi:chromosome condensin MukBEF complex kleisin-like MukF subunit
MRDFHETLARVAREGPRIELGTVQICVLVAMRLVTEDEVLPELDEERLSDLYVRVVEVIEGGSRLPRMKATHGLELLRQQGLLSRVDGAGLVRCGAFSLTRLGYAIAESWIEDESLTRQSLVLLTTALRFKLGERLSDAQAAQHSDSRPPPAVAPHGPVACAVLLGGKTREQRAHPRLARPRHARGCA